MKNPRLFKNALVFFIALGFWSYFPTWMYCLYKLGIINSVMSSGVEIVMKDGWFPLLKNGSLVQNLFGGKSVERASISLYKAKLTLPVTEANIIMFERPKDSVSMDKSPAKHFYFTQKYCWGTAWVTNYENISKIASKDKEWAVVIDEYGLSFVIDDLSLLDEIVEIRTPTNRGLPLVCNNQ